MKKYLILAAGVLTLAACSKNNIENSAPKEISYNAVTAKNNVTKAIIDHAYYAPTDPAFGVWGLYQETNWANNHANGVWVGTNTTTSAKIVYKDVDYDFPDAEPTETNREWRNDSGPDYWPISGTVVFMGYSPYTNVSSKASIGVTDNNVVLTVTGFQSSTGSYEDDLMWSDAVEASANGTEYTATESDAAYNGVPVVFHHALAQITVNAKTLIDYASQGYTFTITNITMHIDDGATLTVSDPVVAETTPTVLWTNPTTDASPSILSSDKELKNEFEKQGRSILVIPQDLATKQGTLDDKLTITYKVIHNGVTSTATKDILLTAGSDANITAFAKNTKYNLNLVFSLDEILYSPSITDWDTPAASVYEVPKDAA